MFSVIIPVYNKLPHLDRAINSVLNQTYKDFELILIDDASTDGSSEKIKEFEDSRIRIFKRDTPGPGGYAARNLGIKKAKYDWIAFLDADDEWDVGYLSVVSDVILREPNSKLISCSWITRRETDNYITMRDNYLTKRYLEFSLVDYLEYPKKYMHTSAVTVNQFIISKAGGFPECCRRGGDLDTWIRWLEASNKNIHINRVLSYYYRDTINQVTGKINKKFCAYETLQRIYSEEYSKAMKMNIRAFNNKFIYGILARQIRAGMPIDYEQIKRMYFNTYAVSRICKLHLMRLKNWMEL
jgi:glycosyltransferase involved in cell wall biosynthesis